MKHYSKCFEMGLEGDLLYVACKLSYVSEPVRRVPLTSQTSQESGTVVMDTPLASSMAAKKTTTAVLFTLEGMDMMLKHEGEVTTVTIFLSEGLDLIDSATEVK